MINMMITTKWRRNNNIENKLENLYNFDQQEKEICETFKNVKHAKEL
jgi:hypothetical protein